MFISLGKWTPDLLDKIISESNKLKDQGKRIESISQNFFETPYKNNTLKGWIDKKEQLTLSLDGVDCFTFIDYVEAMRLSDSYISFLTNLQRIRYKNSTIEFTARNHFFTDWIESNSDFVEDVTGNIGGEKARTKEKILNLKGDGSYFLPGIGTVKRRIVYIPSQYIDIEITEQLKTGDYAGIYTETPGLDVSHVGIIIRASNQTLLRHASSKKEYKKVIDEDFMEYIKNKDGLIVLRPKDNPNILDK